MRRSEGRAAAVASYARGLAAATCKYSMAAAAAATLLLMGLVLVRPDSSAVASASASASALRNGSGWRTASLSVAGNGIVGSTSSRYISFTLDWHLCEVEQPQTPLVRTHALHRQRAKRSVHAASSELGGWKYSTNATGIMRRCCGRICPASYPSRRDFPSMALRWCASGAARQTVSFTTWASCRGQCSEGMIPGAFGTALVPDRTALQWHAGTS